MPLESKGKVEHYLTVSQGNLPTLEPNSEDKPDIIHLRVRARMYAPWIDQATGQKKAPHPTSLPARLGLLMRGTHFYLGPPEGPKTTGLREESTTGPNRFDEEPRCLLHPIFNHHHPENQQ